MYRVFTARVMRRMAADRSGRKRRANLSTCDDGSVTVEAVLWFPILFSLAGVIADVSAIYTANADMWRVAADASRRMAVQEWTVDSAEERVRAALPPRYRADAIVEVQGGSEVSVSIRVPNSAVAPVGLYSSIIRSDIGARVRMSSEWGQTPDFSNLVDGVGAGAPVGGT